MNGSIVGKIAIVMFGVLLLAVVVACGDDEDEHEEEGMAAGMAMESDEHVMEDMVMGIVALPPADASHVYAQLSEWALTLRQSTVPAGKVWILAQNGGPLHSHELVVIRSADPIEGLPQTDGKVPEDQVDFIGEIEEFAPGSSASGVFDLTPGRYLLICNIVETTEGMESHYGEGMRAELIVS